MTVDSPSNQLPELTMCVNKVLGMARGQRKYSLCIKLCCLLAVVLIYKISRDLEWHRLKCSSEVLGRRIIVVRINSGVMRAGVREHPWSNTKTPAHSCTEICCTVI